MRILLLSALCLVSATADQSTNQAMVSKILDALEQTVMSGDDAHAGEALGRKLYVQQMLRLAQNSPQFGTTDTTAFKSAKLLLNDILKSMEDQTTTTQGNLDTMRSAFIHCDDAFAGHGTTLTGHDTARTTAKDAHTTCRNEEQALIANVSSVCSTFRANAITQTTADEGTYDCTAPTGATTSDLIGDIADGVNGEAAEHYYDIWATWFDDQKTHYDDQTTSTEGAVCKEAYTVWMAKNGMSTYAADSCGDLQAVYEGAFCARRAQYTVQCGQNDYCHDYYRGRYTDLNTTYNSNNIQRLKDVGMITYVICLLDTMANGTNNNTVDTMDSGCASLLTDDYTGTYGNNFTTWGARDHATDCTAETFATETNPGSTATTWYAALLAETAAAGVNSGAGFTGPFRTPSGGLCGVTFTYTNTSGAPGYYPAATGSDSNAYWHNATVANPNASP